MSQISERVRWHTGRDASPENMARPPTDTTAAAAAKNAALRNPRAADSTAHVWQEPPQVQPMPRSPPQVQVQSCSASTAASNGKKKQHGKNDTGCFFIFCFFCNIAAEHCPGSFPAVFADLYINNGTRVM